MKIKKRLLGIAVLGGMAYILFPACGSDQTGYGTGSGASCDSSSSSLLSPVLPFDVIIPATDTVLSTQIRRDFDLFSWNSFVALNWSPDAAKKIGVNGDNTTVWETFKESYEIFLPDGKQPAPWGEGSFVPPACAVKKSGNEKMKILMQVGKTPNVLDEMDLPFKTGPLIDQNGMYTRYEIAVNKEMFDYIYTNKLYSFDDQQKFTGTVAFPEGDNDKKVHGAMMVKAAWKILGKDDDPSRFHTAQATIYVPAHVNPVIHETCYVATVGLVGIHIGTKTNISPQWIWSTFEQVDNVPTLGEMINKAHYNYYNKQAGDKNVNNAPARPWNPNIAGQTPCQIMRITKIFEGTEKLNQEFQAAFKAVNPKSVWQYYQLVGTQWPVHPQQGNEGDPFPVYMANASLESYNQGLIVDGKPQYVPGVSSSCIGCHNGATMKSNGKASDFTYLLERAQ